MNQHLQDVLNDINTKLETIDADYSKAVHAHGKLAAANVHRDLAAKCSKLIEAIHSVKKSYQAKKEGIEAQIRHEAEYIQLQGFEDLIEELYGRYI